MEPGLLDELFAGLVDEVFGGRMRIRDRRVLRYLIDVLVSFAHRDRLFAIRDAGRRPVESVARMLEEGDLLLAATTFDREREVHKHVGDFTLFITGVYPEWQRMIQREGGLDALLDYRATGKRSYWVASTFQTPPYRDEAPILRRLSEEYELFEFGLSLVRAELDRLGRPPVS